MAEFYSQSTIPSHGHKLAEELFKKGFQCLRQGDTQGATEHFNIEAALLSKQANFIVEEISTVGILELDKFGNQQQQLKQLHEQLNLAITAQKIDVVDRLNRIRQGKKTIETYRRNI